MPQTDWLIGRDRGTAAADRIYDAAAKLVARRGFEQFSIDRLAAEVHCSPATIYRYAGGKSNILNVVTLRVSARVVEAVLTAIDDAAGNERIVRAITVALERIRAEPLGALMMTSAQGHNDGAWLSASPVVASLAERILGDDDHVAVQWLIRTTFSLWYWPVGDASQEEALVRRFVAGAAISQS